MYIHTHVCTFVRKGERVGYMLLFPQMEHAAHFSFFVW